MKETTISASFGPISARGSRSMPPTESSSWVVQLELGERVGEVVGDREGAPVAEHVDGSRAGELLHRGGEVGGGDVLVQLLERGDAVGDELVEHAARARSARWPARKASMRSR